MAVNDAWCAYTVQNKPYDKCGNLQIAMLYNMMLANTYLLPGPCLPLDGNKHSTWHWYCAHLPHTACIVLQAAA